MECQWYLYLAPCWSVGTVPWCVHISTRFSSSRLLVEGRKPRVEMAFIHNSTRAYVNFTLVSHVLIVEIFRHVLCYWWTNFMPHSFSRYFTAFINLKEKKNSLCTRTKSCAVCERFVTVYKFFDIVTLNYSCSKFKVKVESTAYSPVEILLYFYLCNTRTCEGLLILRGWQESWRCHGSLGLKSFAPFFQLRVGGVYWWFVWITAMWSKGHQQ